MNYNKQEILDLFNDFIFEDSFSEEDIPQLYEYLKKKITNDVFNICCGATKCVIVFTNRNYVIKIPFAGSWEGSEYWEYSCADSNFTEWDYCAVEVERYKKAKKYNFNNYFAKTIYIGLSNNYPIYIQKKCIIFENTTPVIFSPLVKQRCVRIIEKFYTKYKINTNWLIDFMLAYGENQLISFLQFLNNNKWDDDLRNENIGYINSYPVLVDYSGFSEVI